MTRRGEVAVRAARAMALAVAAWLLAGLAGCGAPAPARPAELPTASDQTDAERRARVRLELASAYYTRGQYDTALDETKLALQLSPRLSDAYNLRGLVYAAMGEEERSEDAFRQALLLNPGDGNVLHNRGWMQCQRGRFAEAQALFQAALDLPQYRDVVRTLYARGMCYARAGRDEDAERALMRAYEYDPSSPSTGFSLAEVLYRRKAYDRARFYLGRVNETADNQNAQTLWLALRIERKLGRETEQRLLAQQLKSRYPQSPEAAALGAERFDD